MAVVSKKIPAPDKVRVKTALLSVSDKTGIVELAKALVEQASRFCRPAARTRRLPMPAWR